MLCGGYRTVENPVVDKDISEAAAFVLKEFVLAEDNSAFSGIPKNAVDLKVISASKQVVAGLNLRMEIVFRDQSEKDLSGGTVVVYNRFGTLSITSWEARDNNDDGS